MEPRIQYARTEDGVSIGFWTLGQGPPLLYLTGAPFNHAQLEWHHPSYRVWYDALLERFTVARLDARGSGMSDRKVDDVSPEAQALDIAAVADKLGLETFALDAVQASGLPAVHYALANPKRVSHLILIDSYANGKDFFALPQIRAFRAMMEADWDMFSETLAHVIFGWSAGAPAREMAAFYRECVNQSEALSYFDAVSRADVTGLLPQVSQPTLIVHHKLMPFPTVDTAKLLASRIPNAHLQLLDGTWQDPGDDLDTVTSALDELTGARPTAAPQALDASGGLATILFTDIEGSTALTQRLGDVRARELLREHERLVREQLKAHGGAEVKTMGDGFMASFSSATRALECAIAIQRAVEEGTVLPARPEALEGRAERQPSAHASTGSARADKEGPAQPTPGAPLRVRIGLNAGEPIAEEADLFGTAVIAAARIAAMARGGEVLASDVVRQLVAGRGFLFSDRGETELRGFDDPVRLYEVRWRDTG